MQDRGKLAAPTIIIFFLIVGAVFFFYRETQSLRKSNQDVHLVIHKYEDTLDKVDSKLVDIQERNNYSTNKIKDLEQKVENQANVLQQAAQNTNDTSFVGVIQNSVERTYTQLRDELLGAFSSIHTRLKGLSDRVDKMEKLMNQRRIQGSLPEPPRPQPQIQVAPPASANAPSNTGNPNLPQIQIQQTPSPIIIQQVPVPSPYPVPVPTPPPIFIHPQIMVVIDLLLRHIFNHNNVLKHLHNRDVDLVCNFSIS